MNGTPTATNRQRLHDLKPEVIAASTL